MLRKTGGSMKILITLLITITFSSMGYASLEEEVDKLSPEEAQRIMVKLQAKTLQPIPESFFTNLALSGSFGGHAPQLSEFKKSLDTKQKGEFSFLNFGSASILWVGHPKWRFGLSGRGLYKLSSKELSTDLFQDIRVRAMSTHVKAGYTLSRSDQWILLPMIGIGSVSVDVDVETHSDSTTSALGAVASHIYNYSGENFSAIASLSALYRLNPVLSIGMELGYQHARVEKLERSGETEIDSPKDLDLSGGFAAITFGYNL
jgi:hypothetical protein